MQFYTAINIAEYSRICKICNICKILAPVRLHFNPSLLLWQLLVFQQICFSWCLFCSCLFILQTRFMFYPARCLWWKCKTFDTPIQRLDLYFYFDLYLPYGRNLTLDQNIWKTRLNIPQERDNNPSPWL